MRKIVKIQGETNIHNMGAFDELLEQYGKRSRVTETQFGIGQKGNFGLYALMPYIRDSEVDSFQNNPVRFYRKELSDGAISTSIRGMVTVDMVHIPFSSLIPLQDVVKQDTYIEAYLIDSATDTIKGYRLVKVPEKVMAQILDDWYSMERDGVTNSEILTSMNRDMFPFSPKEFVKRSQYIGRDSGDTTPPNVVFFGREVA